MNREELFDLLPAYALGALDGDDRAAVESWLPTDAEARQVLEEYRDIVGVMPLAAPAVPAPASLRADMQKRLAASRWQPAPRPTLRRRWLPLAAGLAAAFLLVLAGLLLALRSSDPGAALYDRLMAQPGAREIALAPALEPTITGALVASADGREAVIRVENLPDIGEDQTYQLWLVDEAGARSGGLFRFADPAGANFIILPLEKPVSEYQVFGVSLEPAGGSPFADRASGPRVFRVEVNA